MQMVNAPFTAEQVKSINGYQNDRFMHEFTCPNHSSVLLMATLEGLECPVCTYQQFWVYEFIANDRWQELRRMQQEIFSRIKGGA